MTKPVDNLPALPLDLDAEGKKLLDQIAKDIGRSAVNHLKQMYPEALAGVTKNAEISLTNHVRNQINHHMRPLVERLVDQKKKGLL